MARIKHLAPILPGRRSAKLLPCLLLLINLPLPTLASEPETRLILPGHTVELQFTIDGEPATWSGFEGAHHGLLEPIVGGMVYIPRASFFAVGSDLVHFFLRKTRFSATVRHTVVFVAHDRPSPVVRRIGFETDEEVDEVVQGASNRFERSALAAFEGETGLIIHPGAGAALVSVPASALALNSEGDHSSETKTEIEPPWPPVATSQQPTSDTWRVLHYIGGTADSTSIEVFLQARPEEEAYAYLVQVDGVSVAGIASHLVGEPPHTLALRTFSLPEGDGYQLRVNEEVVGQATHRSKALWPPINVTLGATEWLADAALSLDALAVRTGGLTPSMALFFREPFEAGELSPEWLVRSPQRVQIEAWDDSDANLQVTVSEPKTGPAASIERTLEPQLRDFFVRFRFDPTSLNVPPGKKIAIFATRDGSGIQTRLWWARDGVGDHKLHLTAKDDNGSMRIDRSPKVDLEPMTLELRWQRSLGANRASGRMTLWHEGERVAWLEVLDDNGRVVNDLRLGALYASSDEVAGVLRFDDISLWTDIE